VGAASGTRCQAEGHSSDGAGSARSCALSVAKGGIDCRGQMPATGSSPAGHMQCPPVEIVRKITLETCPSINPLVPSSEAGPGLRNTMGTVMEPPAQGHASLFRSPSGPPDGDGADPMPVTGTHGGNRGSPQSLSRTCPAPDMATPPPLGPRHPTSTSGSPDGIDVLCPRPPVPQSNAWDQGTSGVEDRAGWTDPPSGHNLRGAWTMALHEHHARHEDHDTGSTHPSSHRRSRALRSTTGSTRSCSGCPPRCSIALETGGPPDELIEGAQ
jgi:hypothetical protein